MRYPLTLSRERSAQPLATDETPAPGAHLVTPWLGFIHHGVYVGDGRVVHYGALMYDIIRKPVEEVTLAQFCGGRPIYVVRHAEDCIDTEEVIRRARSRLGENRYRLLTNNCEHFVEWCLHDVPRSFQVDVSLEFSRLMGERIQGAVLRAVSRLFRFPLPARIPRDGSRDL